MHVPRSHVSKSASGSRWGTPRFKPRPHRADGNSADENSAANRKSIVLALLALTFTYACTHTSGSNGNSTAQATTDSSTSDAATPGAASTQTVYSSDVSSYASGNPVPNPTDVATPDAAADAASDAPADAASDAAVDAASELPECDALPAFVEPTKLSETGLFSDIEQQTLADGVRPFEPRFALWSDGAEKRRWVYLPPCSQINSHNPDYWNYPVGTKLWKEFTRNDTTGKTVRVETRLLQKYTKTKWFMAAFLWNDAQTDALRITGDGPDVMVAALNAKGTEHDVPGQKACESCHYQMADNVLGFSALQLAAPAPSNFVTLDTLVTEGRLSEAPTLPLTLPGTAKQQAALGYVHANCGNCHNPYAKQSNFEMQLWLTLDGLSKLEDTQIYRSTVNQLNKAPDAPPCQPQYRILPQNPDGSSLYWRMRQPPSYPVTAMGGVHMPLIGSELIDANGVDLIKEFINSLNVAAEPNPGPLCP